MNENSLITNVAHIHTIFINIYMVKIKIPLPFCQTRLTQTFIAKAFSFFLRLVSTFKDLLFASHFAHWI